eukprot:TRINITY_DN11897_c0_g1_i1.p1 TRINITY_DN11897_c0_g1~~TRINITY_DN11897_c0_g1_i1.p1  ORF type:complete len:1210 (+),score=229.18 TRINITY_DN11897_c0_g1_i1:429-3632(+)
MSKLEKTKMQAALQRQRENIAQPQVVAGKQFEGQPFVANPTTIEFADFDVGKTYSQTVTMTNISYGGNSFKMEPAEIADISYDYQPVGTLSAGLSTLVTVIFTPQSNVDIDTNMVLLTQSGRMSVPIRCRRKRCEVTVSEQDIDLGSIWLGETKTYALQITNAGALATRYSIVRQDGSKPAVSADEGSLPPVLSIDGTLEGFLAPRTAIVMDLCYTPREPGTLNEQYRIVLSDSGLDDIVMTVQAECNDIPVFFATKAIDLKMCCEDHEYQAVAEVNNTNPTSSSKAFFSLPPATKGCIELKPASSVLQPNSTLSLCIIFRPDANTLDELRDFTEEDTGKITLPVTMQVEGQALGSELTLTAHVTPSRLELSTTSLDFGSVSVYETALQSVKITNHSALAQQFAFQKMPEYLSIQPRHGIGTVLPFETIDVDVLFSPPRHPHDDDDRKFKAELLLEGEYAVRSERLLCKGIGCVPPVRFSSSQVQFAATCLGDRRAQSVTLSNIGQGELVYELVAPVDLGLTVSPVAGKLKAGEVQQLWLQFAPKKMHYMHSVLKAQTEEDTMTTTDTRDELASGDKRSDSANESDGPEADPASSTSRSAQALESMDMAMKPLPMPLFNRATVTCFCAATATAQPRSQDKAVLAVELPVLEPVITLVDDDRRSMATFEHDFGRVALEQQEVVSVTIKNNSDAEVSLTASIMDSAGAFRLLRALRPLSPHGTQRLTLAFKPGMAIPFLEDFDIACKEQTLRLRLRGVGVRPSVCIDTLSNEVDSRCEAALAHPPLLPNYLTCGDILVSEVQTRKFVIRNESDVPVDVRASLASENTPFDPPVVKYNQHKQLPEQHRTAGPVDVKNWGTQPSFKAYPTQFTLPPAGKQEVAVHFQPDHASLHFRDVLLLAYNAHREPAKVDLRGRAWNTSIFHFGTDKTGIDVDNLPSSQLVTLQDADQAEQHTLHMLYKLDQQTSLSASFADIFFGVINASDGKKVPGGELVLEQLSSEAVKKGFAIEPANRLVLDSGCVKACRINFQPGKGVAIAAGMAFEAIMKGTLKSAGICKLYTVNVTVRVIE